MADEPPCNVDMTKGTPIHVSDVNTCSSSVAVVSPGRNGPYSPVNKPAAKEAPFMATCCTYEAFSKRTDDEISALEDAVRESYGLTDATES